MDNQGGYDAGQPAAHLTPDLPRAPDTSELAARGALVALKAEAEAPPPGWPVPTSRSSASLASAPSGSSYGPGMTMPGEALGAFPSDVPATDVVQIKLDGPGNTALGPMDPPMPMTSPMGAFSPGVVIAPPPPRAQPSRAPMLVGILALAVAGLGVAAFVVHRQNQAAAEEEEVAPVEVAKKKPKASAAPTATAADTATAAPVDDPEDPEEVDPQETATPSATAAPTSTAPVATNTTPKPTATTTAAKPTATTTTTSPANTGGLKYPGSKPTATTTATAKPTTTTTAKPTTTTTAKPPTTTKPPTTAKPPVSKPSKPTRPVRPTRPTKK